MPPHDGLSDQVVGISNCKRGQERKGTPKSVLIFSSRKTSPILLRARSTTTRDRNLQLRGTISTVLNLLQWISSLFSRYSMSFRKEITQNVEKIARFPGREKIAESCHVCGCHGFFGPVLLSQNFPTTPMEGIWPNCPFFAKMSGTKSGGPFSPGPCWLFWVIVCNAVASRKGQAINMTATRDFSQIIQCMVPTSDQITWRRLLSVRGVAKWGVTKWGLSGASASADHTAALEAKPPTRNCRESCILSTSDALCVTPRFVTCLFVACQFVTANFGTPTPRPLQKSQKFVPHCQ